MSIKYSPVNDERRHELIRLIHEEQIPIRQAAMRINISYPTAKAINRIYKNEGRIDKKKVRVRRSRVPLAVQSDLKSVTEKLEPADGILPGDQIMGNHLKFVSEELPMTNSHLLALLPQEPPI